MASKKLFRSVFNVLRGDSPAYCESEEEIVNLTGIAYCYVPVRVVTSQILIEILHKLKDLQTPILVHDDTGQRAGLLVLLRAAQQKFMTGRHSYFDSRIN